jgi:hypothetical protein
MRISFSLLYWTEVVSDGESVSRLIYESRRNFKHGRPTGSPLHAHDLKSPKRRLCDEHSAFNSRIYAPVSDLCLSTAAYTRGALLDERLSAVDLACFSLDTLAVVRHIDRRMLQAGFLGGKGQQMAL